MSQKLIMLSNHHDVTLYPNIDMKQVNHLFIQSDTFLDINYGEEILNATRKAFKHTLAIFVARVICHQPQMVAPQAIFFNTDELVATIKILYHQKLL